MNKISTKYLREENPEKCLKTTNGEKMAKKIGAVAYIENSSLTKEGVSHVRKFFNNKV